jgi:hypothetical protein
MLEIEREASTAAHWAESDYANALTNPSPRRLILVAEQDQHVEGFLVARCAHAAEWEIENVVVAEAARSTNVATSCDCSSRSSRIEPRRTPSLRKIRLPA